MLNLGSAVVTSGVVREKRKGRQVPCRFLKRTGLPASELRQLVLVLSC